MKKIIITVVVLVIIAALAVLAMGKGGMNKAATSTQKYASPDGLFTLAYPEGWTKAAEEQGAVTFTKGDAQRVSVAIDYENIIYNLFSTGIQLQPGADLTVDGKTVKTFTTSDKTGSTTLYATIQVMPLTASSSLIVSVVGSDAKEGTEIINSVMIDETKITSATAAVAQQVAVARANALEAQAVAIVGAIKTGSATFFEKPKSYAGFCKDAGVMAALKAFTDAGLQTSCKDAKAAYAVTAQLPSAKFYCVDSAGFAGETKGLNTATVCLK